MIDSYTRRKNTVVVAVQLNLDTEGLKYKKWGGEQFAKAGDWLLNNGGEVYTVDKDSFAKTYQELRRGHYIKVSTVYAKIAETDGHIVTKEGKSAYCAGDYLVYNNEDGTDGYCMSSNKFKELYLLVPPPKVH